MNQEKWNKAILNGVRVLSNPRIDLGDNQLTANAILPFWQDFIANHSDLSPDELQTWHNLKTDEEQILFISGIRPNLNFQLFWAEVMKKALKVKS